MPNNRMKEGGNNCREHKLLDGNEEMEKEGVNQREDFLYCFDRSWGEQQRRNWEILEFFRAFNLNQE